ncbi:tRNA (guanine-N(7)-)-methyltransferase non-catalytic subunit WDR4 isoform X2 [Hemicordylus capensis]|uniref:tRNA (guanine-N(7)-)-methyltransferase non-catalytic subunit WDR4 isoform X2 n=1 Tax=Hemicordylus capensis TaxID=884348 RepID=UPI00230425E7|nr:tRNA (guanine-N(7)-)-methyltransferase non-catalytic subunit WDR4 isoform X2 [Hemicordylus capensis]
MGIPVRGNTGAEAACREQTSFFWRHSPTITSRLLHIWPGLIFWAKTAAGKDDLFIYDCTTVSKNPQENEGEDGKSAGKANHEILAYAFSSSGTYFALTSDSKLLILFRTKPSWECLSVRSVIRRCTSLIITAAEDKILVADKSGDVYSYSITEPDKAGTLELGHLSLLLDVALSPDDQYILTADRDEKIRISLTRAPHNIVSFCLGHREFVSRIFVIPNNPDLLLSASGDCTLRLWEYKSGKEVHCCHLDSLNPCEATKTGKKYAVSRTVYCCEGNYIAILYDCVPTVSIFQLDPAAQKLIYKQHISLSHKGWGIAFEETGGLWILQEDKQTPLLFYQPMDGQWQLATEDKGLMKMSKYLHDNWAVFEGSVGKESCYRNLYKASFDNMAVYLQKKEERLQQQKNKRKEPEHESNGQTKKIKTGAPSL